jgi:hypothetical protein
VLVHNTRKAITKRKGNLEPNYTGPYIVTKFEGKLTNSKTVSGDELKKKYNVDQLKVFISPETDDKDFTTSTGQEPQPTSGYKSSTPYINPKDLKTKSYLQQIKADGSLKQLIEIVAKMDLSKPTSLSNLSRMLKECPIKKFCVRGKIIELQHKLKSKFKKTFVFS